MNEDDIVKNTRRNYNFSKSSSRVLIALLYLVDMV